MKKPNFITIFVVLIAIFGVFSASGMQKPKDPYVKAIDEYNSAAVEQLLKNNQPLTVEAIRKFRFTVDVLTQGLERAEKSTYETPESIRSRRNELSKLDEIGDLFRKLYLKKGGTKPTGVSKAEWSDFKMKVYPSEETERLKKELFAPPSREVQQSRTEIDALLKKLNTKEVETVQQKKAMQESSTSIDELLRKLKTEREEREKVEAQVKSTTQKMLEELEDQKRKKMIEDLGID